MEEASAFLMESIFGDNPNTHHFFTVYDEPLNCSFCHEKKFFLRETKNKNYWCALCYVNKFCIIEKSDEGTIIRLKVSNRIMYNSTKKNSDNVEQLSCDIVEVNDS